MLQLSKQEDYQGAGWVKKMMESELDKVHKKKYYEWKNHKDKQLGSLKKRQAKDLSGLRTRLQIMFDE